jgi:hypothetical protein
MPNKPKKTHKREDDLKALGLYTDNPDDTVAVDLLEEEGLESSLLTEDPTEGGEEEEE